VNTLDTLKANTITEEAGSMVFMGIIHNTTPDISAARSLCVFLLAPYELLEKQICTPCLTSRLAALPASSLGRDRKETSTSASFNHPRPRGQAKGRSSLSSLHCEASWLRHEYVFNKHLTKSPRATASRNENLANLGPFKELVRLDRISDQSIRTSKLFV
jgi:hypothetical protein